MKILLIATLLFVTSAGWTQIKFSVASGDWNNPSNWNPAVVPLFNEDTVVVYHHLTTSAATEVGIDHLVVSPFASITATNTFALHGSLRVDGLFTADTLITGDGLLMWNFGTIDVGVFVATNPVNENHGSILISDMFANVEPFTNMSDGLIEVGSFTTTSDADFVNNGSIHTVDWLNEGTILGTGSICIDQCFKNVGAIEGSLDVCDATPNSGLPCDFNFGTVSSGVTFCVNSACLGVSGLTNSNANTEVRLSPNPVVESMLNIETDLIIHSIAIVDGSGRTVWQKSDGDVHWIDLSSFENGNYLIVIRTGDQTITKSVLKSNW